MSAISSSQYWESTGGRAFPSLLNVEARNIIDLLTRNIVPGDKVLEIGCAPGRYLMWCALIRGANVSGVDGVPNRHRETVEFFSTMGVEADLRCEEIVSTSFSDSSFDVVYSLDLISHLTDSQVRIFLRKQVSLLKPLGIAIVVIPNLSGWYGAWLRRNDPASYAMYNVDIMSVEALQAAAPPGNSISAFKYGSLASWPARFDTPRRISSKVAANAANIIGLLQPFMIGALCPSLVLEIRRAS